MAYLYSFHSHPHGIGKAVNALPSGCDIICSDSEQIDRICVDNILRPISLCAESQLSLLCKT